MNTPGNLQRLAELQKFYAKGEIPSAWRDRPMLIVFRDAAVWQQRVAGFAPSPIELAYRNSSYTVVRVRPAPTTTH
jgi:hypothetical protein